jgi:hypothetical protein
VAGLGYDVESVVALASITLVVALLSTLIGLVLHRVAARRRGEDPRADLGDMRYYQVDPAARPLHHVGVGLVWMASTVLVVERAVHVGVNGWLAVGLWLLITVVVLAVYGVVVVGGRNRRRLQAERGARVQAHHVFVRERQHLAQQLALRGAGSYEDWSVPFAEGFGRLAQNVPDDFVAAEQRHARMREGLTIERLAPVLRHAATLQAEAVLHTHLMGVTTVVFDLELLDQDKLLDRGDGFISDLAAATEAAKRYLTVWMAELPMALPFVSSLFAYELAYSRPEYARQGGPTRTRVAWRNSLLAGAAAAPGLSADHIHLHTDGLVGSVAGYDTDDHQTLVRHRIDLMTDNERFARHLMALPAVRQAALAASAPPFFIDGDRLVTSEFSPSGTAAATVEAGIQRMATLVQAIPWNDVSSYRVDPADYQRRRIDRFHLTHDSVQPTLERWQKVNTRSGPNVFQRSHKLHWQQLQAY